MPVKVRYVHTNIVAGDWKNLAGFYIKVFNCKPLLPERNLYGKWIDRATNIDNAHIQGVHLRLPGYKESGPTLEIFQYSTQMKDKGKAINRQGVSHIAFAVDDVDSALALVKREGGSQLGEVVTTEIAQTGTIKFVYAKDPEGNIIELQKWS
jgi:predicted enzyme related to lactoylglutathione lyase